MASFQLDPAIYEPYELEPLQKLIAKLEANHINPEKWEDYQKRKDIFLIRFLKAHKYDVDKSYEKFVRFVAWRNENNVDNVLWERDNDPVLKQLHETWPAVLHKTDNAGLPVLYEKIGPADVKGLFQAYPDIKYWIRNHILMHEQTNHLIFTHYPQVLNQPYQGLIFIEDLKGLSWHHWHTPAISVMKAVSQIDTEYYPHAVRKLYIINAPSIFTWMWKLVKPWLDPFTANSMSILGANYYEVLSKEIPAENFPHEYGGKCECPNGCLPKAGMFGGHSRDDVVHAHIARHSFLKVPVVVESGCTLRWEFTTRENDIAFGLLYENEAGNQSALVPVVRYQSQHQKIIGSFTALHSGSHVLCWDNSYSLLRAKDLSYKVTVEIDTTPEGPCC